jgi:hypothetical protein
MSKQCFGYYLFLIKLEKVFIQLAALLAFIQSSRGFL